MTDSSFLMIDHTIGSARETADAQSGGQTGETRHNVRVCERLQSEFEADNIRMPDELVHSKAQRAMPRALPALEIPRPSSQHANNIQHFDDEKRHACAR